MDIKTLARHAPFTAKSGTSSVYGLNRYGCIILFCVAFSLTLLIVLQPVRGREGWPTKYECGFTAEKTENGKSMSASCSLSPELVLSTRNNPKQPWDHCNVERVSGYSDLVNFLVDTDRSSVSWEEHIGFIESTKERMTRYYIQREGLSESEARNKANRKPQSIVKYYPIFQTAKIADALLFDSIAGKMLNSPKNFPALLVMFGDDVSNYVLYLSGASDQAILSEYASTEEAAWVTLRFGRCRKLR